MLMCIYIWAFILEVYDKDFFKNCFEVATQRTYTGKLVPGLYFEEINSDFDLLYTKVRITTENLDPEFLVWAFSRFIICEK